MSRYSFDTNSVDRQYIQAAVALYFLPISAKKISEWILQTLYGLQNKKAFAANGVTEHLNDLLKQGVVSCDANKQYSIDDDYKKDALEWCCQNKEISEDLHIRFPNVFSVLTYVSSWSQPDHARNTYIYLIGQIALNHPKISFRPLNSALDLSSANAPNTLLAFINRCHDEFLYVVCSLNRFSVVDETFLKLVLKLKSDALLSSGITLQKLPPVLHDNLSVQNIIPVLDLLSLSDAFVAGRFDEILERTNQSKLMLHLLFRYCVLQARARNAELAELRAKMQTSIDEFEFMTSPLSLFMLPSIIKSGNYKKTKLTSALKTKIGGYQLIVVAAVKYIEQVGAVERFRGEIYKSLSYEPLNVFTKFLGYYWLGAEFRDDEFSALVDYATEFNKHKAYYYELEFTQLAALVSEDERLVARAAELKTQIGVEQCLSEIYSPPSAWELQLKQLCSIALEGAVVETQAKEERLVWLLDVRHGHIKPVLQKASKSGWSAGRNVALQKLKDHELTCLSAHDERVISHLRLNRDYYGSNYDFDSGAIHELVGHPLLFNADAPSVPLELVKEDIYLVVDEKKDKCQFSFSHDLYQAGTMQKISTNKYSIISASESIKKVAQIIGTKGLTVPKTAKPQVLDALKHLSGAVKIESPLLGEQTGAERVDPSTMLYVHLLPVGNGIKAELFVKPFETEPPYLRPTEGTAKITAVRNGKHIYTERVFSLENKQVSLLMERCPVFASQAEVEMAAHFEHPADCLQVLSELRDTTDLAVVEWPRGQRFSLRSRISFGNFSMAIKKQNNWFDVSGQVQVDEQTVMDLKQLLQLLENAEGRFVQIEDGVYIELEKHFVRQLEFLKTVADVGTKTIKLHPLAAISGAGLFDSAANLESDKEWNKYIDTIRKADNAKYPLPRGIDAELRPYQEEGYRWMRKMADWGTGACLADDMGLGKTLQCLVLLQSRAKEGPSMVVAPSSVCRNWISETERFTPGMQAVLFGGSDRKQLVESLEAGAILVVSYGLLHTEAELLCSRKWNVLILDEAHAIKNISTKRSQAAMSIDAQFRIAATGTPLQNHLGELWNLFQFLNPGLLGSQQSFNERFVTPIERTNSEIARRTLKDLIKPFILRRTKNQVLTELPEKTEITLSIEMSDEERAFYEALRVKALEDLQKLDDTTNAGEKQLRVLAEIMKLRRACCHPSLANAAVKIDSSKLQRFEELVDTLLENGHKALVFSQFVDHLKIMRTLLDDKGISYEYLDGSTPGKEREESIRRYQAGSTDIFLISLKAGGVGLNLTAADYVIHMDPWWNPAVEDQASDRAHRIGQTKPVTIYRLVAKDTIEERIVELHKNKRDLADNLLEGTEGAAKVTADELVALLRGM